jgi:type II restriction enzyme
MARKADLRIQRAGTIINLTSRKQETTLGQALEKVIAKLIADFGVILTHKKDWLLEDVIAQLRKEFTDVPFGEPLARSSMRPDGGILAVTASDGREHPILIAEVKNQGTNDARTAEGKARQAMGNAIERLGKNVIGFRAAMLSESIMPFVCFGYGCDFAEGSSIRDRVLTIAMFGRLNEVCVVNAGEGGHFNRGSFFFREEEWSQDEMVDVMYDVASRSIHYYYAKYGLHAFPRQGLAS